MTKHPKADSEPAGSLVGTKHHRLLAWLATDWLRDGPPVCFVEGFSGVGKTEIAYTLLGQSRATHTCISVTFPEGTSDPLMDLLWDLAGEMDSPEVAATLGNRKELIRSFVNQLAKPVLIVVDEFQRGLTDTGEPLAEIAQLLERIGQARGVPGRLLLLTNRTVSNGRWTEPHTVRTLERLDTAEGIALLERHLDQRGLEAEVPEDRRADLVEWVGGNPRAIRTVVESLRGTPLNDLIGLAKEIWKLEEREVAPELVRELEKRLLDQTVSRLGAASQTALRNLAAYRKPFTREALEGITPDLLTSLVDRFLLKHQGRDYALTEVVREVQLRRLIEDPGVRRLAHSRAADYYARHFKARQMVQFHRLGGNFIEARYHLVHAGREAELHEIAARFSSELRTLYGRTARVPPDPGERNERIAVLSALLDTQGERGLHYYLARLLKARGAAGDAGRALAQARMAAGPQAPADTWVVLIELAGAVEGPDAALAEFRRGAAVVPPEKNLFSLYQSCAELLAAAGRIREAIALLRDGIRRIPPEQSQVSLYQLCAELLARDGQTAQAVELLREGITRIRPEQSLASLYQICAELLASDGRIAEAVALLREGIRYIRPEQNLVSLYQSCAELLARDGDTAQAVEMLRDGIPRIRPDQNLAMLFQTLSAIYLNSGNYREAFKVQLAGVDALPPRRFNRERLEQGAGLIALLLRDTDALRELVGRDSDGIAQTYFDTVSLEIAEQWTAAATRAQMGRHVITKHAALTSRESFCWLAAGRHDLAMESLARYPGGLRLDPGGASSWLDAFVALRNGETSRAIRSIEAFLDRPLTPLDDPNEALLLRLWDQSAGQPGPNPSYIFPHLPPSLTGLPQTVTRFPAGPPVFGSDPEASNDGIRILVVATEWNPGHGGLSLNQALCRALARAGKHVDCLVPQCTDAEAAEALAAGVHLISANADPGDSVDARLYRRPRVSAEPHVVIGHGRRTGPAAKVQSTDYFPESVRVQFVHTAPDHIEWFKDRQSGQESAAVAEERTRMEVELAAGAGLVVGVGPLLTDWIETRLRFGRGADAPIHRLDPGLAAIAPSPGPPPETICLLLGRAEDEILKGIDIAAGALSRIPARSLSRLVVRGAPEGKADTLQVHLRAANANGVRVDVRRYTADVARVGEDIRQASLLLMPSRSEGFGLVGLEAISAGVPVLVSAESGLGRLLRELAPSLAQHFVVEVLDVEKEDAATWAREIDFVLRDRKAAFARSRELLDVLRPRLTWDLAVARFLDVLTPLLPASAQTAG